MKGRAERAQPRHDAPVRRVTVRVGPLPGDVLAASIAIKSGDLAPMRVEEAVWSKAEALGMAYRLARQHGAVEIVVEDRSGARAAVYRLD